MMEAITPLQDEKQSLYFLGIRTSEPAIDRYVTLDKSVNQIFLVCKVRGAGFCLLSASSQLWHSEVYVIIPKAENR